MTTEIIDVGGKIDMDLIPHGAYPTYRENRGISDIESELGKKGFIFSFSEMLDDLVGKFPHTSPIEILEGGCGDGFALGSLKKLAQVKGIPLRTSGATNAQRNAAKVVEMDTDVLYLGDIRSAFQKGVLPPSKFHLILDYYGAARHDTLQTAEGWIEGGNIIPIYSHILVDGGYALVTLNDLDPEWDKQWSKRNFSANMKALLHYNCFSIIKSERDIVLLQKRSGEKK